MDFWSYISLLAMILFLMSIVFVIAQFLKNNSIVDIFWGISFCIITLVGATSAEPYLRGLRSNFELLRANMVSLFVLIWGIRLATYIFIRNKGNGEDWRYQNFRKNWKNHPYLGAFFQVFMLQGFILFWVILPVIHIQIISTRLFGIIDIIGICIWVIGFLFESIGDTQLYFFKNKPENKGKIMQYGLWKYTRHPNYFGEICMWWAIWIISIDFAFPLATIIGLISPIILTFLLVKVSGVPMLEGKYKTNETYQKYIANTPSLFPKFFK